MRWRTSAVTPRGSWRRTRPAGFTVLNGVNQYNITYYSDGNEITGSVYFPDSTPPAGGFGVVVMNQFTSGIGPSCAPSVGELSIGVASAAAMNGFVTLVPDATSYGDVPYGGYLIEKVAGRAALDGARAAFHTLTVAPIAQRAVIAGLSQGAYSTMAAATESPAYAPHLAVRGFAAAEPPSNLAHRVSGRSRRGSSTNIVYDAMRLWSWQGDLKLSGGQIFLPPYDTNAPMWFASACNYNGVDGSSGTLNDDNPTNASAVQSDAYLGYATGNSRPDDWAAAYAASGEHPQQGMKLPVLIFEGSDDVTVLPANDRHLRPAAPGCRRQRRFPADSRRNARDDRPELLHDAAGRERPGRGLDHHPARQLRFSSRQPRVAECGWAIASAGHTRVDTRTAVH